MNDGRIRDVMTTSEFYADNQMREKGHDQWLRAIQGVHGPAFKSINQFFVERKSLNDKIDTYINNIKTTMNIDEKELTNRYMNKQLIYEIIKKNEDIAENVDWVKTRKEEAATKAVEAEANAVAEAKKVAEEAAEAEEAKFYAGGGGDEWIKALEPIGTNADKPHLDIAPWLIVIFAQRYGVFDDGTRFKNYYVTESVGIATGFLISALHHAGLYSLTHTPNPMGFLNPLLGRPKHEKAVMILAVGHASKDATVPSVAKIKKPLDEILTLI